MTILSYKHNFIFIKSRKTAGTSIQKSLLPYCGTSDIVTMGWDNLINQQRCVIEEFATIDEIEQHFGVAREHFFSFGFTRNPYAITLSRYFYQLKRKRVIEEPNKGNFNQWVKDVYFVGEEGFPQGRYIKDRSRFLLFDDAMKPLVNYIGKVETIDSDFKYICQKIGLENVTLEHINKTASNKTQYKAWFDDKSYELVTTHFDKELKYFDYQFEE